MAVSRIKPRAAGLFERIPDRLFAPLGSKNRRGYWALLCNLLRRRFGPDAPLPPSYGFMQRDITQEIEDHLRYATEWQPDDGEPFDTPINVRALAQFNYLVDTGWLRLERHGLEFTVNMSPAVTQLLTQLVMFAETGPVFVSGKIRSIDGAIALVLKGEATGDSLREAAEQCRNLLLYIRNTGTNVRELMVTIGQHENTAQYVRSFFQDFVSEVFIGDYRELRTNDHPLSKRQQILDAVEKIEIDPTHRQRLLDWYVQRLSGGDESKGKEAFDRDILRLNELRRIEEYLDRLDSEILTANNRARAVIEYRIRSPRPIDNTLRHAIDHLLKALDGAEVHPVFPPDVMISGARLAQPRKESAPKKPSKFRNVVISDRTRAINNLVKLAQQRRAVTPAVLMAFADRVLEDVKSVDIGNLPSGSIEDLRAQQVLASAAMSLSSGIRQHQMLGRSMAPGLDIHYTSETMSELPFLSTKAFRISKRPRRTPLSTFRETNNE